MITIPTAMEGYKQFICWTLVDKGGKKPAKIPTDPMTGLPINAMDPAVWMDSATVMRFAAMGYGVGFVFTKEDNYFFLDIDDCLEPTGNWSNLATHMRTMFTGAYSEVSYSGKGLHIIGSGTYPAHGCKNTQLNMEFYTNSRFVALTSTNATGDAAMVNQGAIDTLVTTYFPAGTEGSIGDWTTGPCEESYGIIEDDEKLIKKMLKSKSAAAHFGTRATINELWTADPAALAKHYPDPTREFDHSSADAALLSHLSFWTGKDCQRMDRLFRLSALMRPKWDRKEGTYGSYGNRSILKACAQCDNVYGSNRKPAEQPLAETANVLSWVKEKEKNVVAANWLEQIKPLDAVGRDSVRRAVSEKTEIGLSPLKSLLTQREKEWRQAEIVEQNNRSSERCRSKGKVEIEYSEANTFEMALQAAQAVFNDENPKNNLVLRHSSNFVVIENDTPKTVRMVSQLRDKESYPQMPLIKPLTIITMRHRIEQSAVCVVRDSSKGDRCIQWTSVVVNGVLEQHAVEAKPLTGIVEHPFIDDKMQPVTTQGYNANTGLYVQYDVRLCATLRPNPNPQDVESAYRYLATVVLADFPFADELDRVGAIAALMTALQRKMIDDDSGCPGFLFDAPVQSTGKTTLAQLICYAIFGRPAPATAWSDNDTEMGKHLLAILLEGHGCVLFDNLPAGTTFKSNELAKAMTGNSYSGRILGKTETSTVPSSVLWMATGNNISIVGDFNTRILSVRLDSRVADPDRRTFTRKDIGRWCLKNRAEIIKACLTIIIGTPLKDPPKPTRYLGWDKFVRLPLLAASGIDVAGLFDRNKLADPEVEGRRFFLEAMYNVYTNEFVTTGEILRRIENRFIPNDIEGVHGQQNNAPLYEALHDIFPKGMPNSKGLGKWLGKLKGQVLGGYRLSCKTGTSGDNKNRKLWMVEKIGDEK